MMQRQLADRVPDEEPRPQFKPLSAMSAGERELVKAMLDVIVVKDQVAGVVQRFNTLAPKTRKTARERARA